MTKVVVVPSTRAGGTRDSIGVSFGPLPRSQPAFDRMVPRGGDTGQWM